MLNKKFKWLLFIVFVLVVILNKSSFVKAENINCCQWTNNNKFCVESTDIEFKDYGGCKAGYKSSYTSCSSNNVPQCKLGTCVPSNTGECLANKFKVECTQNNKGKWFDQEIRSVPECQVGCCNVGGSVCSLQEKKVCVQDLANGDAGSFNPSITNSLECDNSCRGADVGTCKTESGCRYTTRGLCTGEFFSNKYAREVIGCFVKSHNYKACGNGISDNDKYNVYWFDSNDNREEIVEECSYPDEKCSDVDGLRGEDAKCVSTKCVQACPDCYPSELKSGESVCLNVLGGHFDNNKRSKGLSNYILHCEYGVVDTDNIDKNRDSRCIEGVGVDGFFNADWRSNNWQECSKCGEGNGAIPASDYLGFAPIFGQLLIGTVGKACSEGGAWRFDKCEEFGNGDCGSIFNDNAYDDDFIWPPLGSCNPQYPPGDGSRSYGDPVNRCKQCGQGGDSATNQCTREECNTMGDCIFEPTISGGLGNTAGLALGTCASAAVTAYLLQFIPFIGQGATIGAVAACRGPGPDLLYWGLVGSVYSIGAAEASEISEYQVSQDVIKDGKVRLGPALALSKGLVKNLTSSGDLNISKLGHLNRKENGRAAEYAAYSAISSFFVPFGAAGIIGLSKTFTVEQGFKAFSSAYGALPNTGQLTEIALTRDVTTNELKTWASASLTKVLTVAGIASQVYTTAKSFDTGVCLPESEKGYTDNSRCGLCGAAEGQWYCTEERCNVLGGKLADDPRSGHCKWLMLNKTGTNDGLCISKEPDDLTIPIITKVNVQLFDNIGNKINEFSANGKQLDVPSLLPWSVQRIKITIGTNERSDCRYTNDIGISYDGASSFEDLAYPLSHSTDVNITETVKVGGINYYFKCLDVNGNKINSADDSNYLKIKFDKRPDTSAPIPVSLDPRNVFLPEKVRDIKVSLLMYDENDVDSCKFSKDKVNFDEMESTFTRSPTKTTCVDTTSNDCREFTTNYNLVGGQNITVEGYSQNLTVYPIIIKCKDTKGNLMLEPYNTSIFVIPTFTINITKPMENEKVWDRTPLINVTTGAIAFCNYSIGNEIFSFSDSNTEHVIEHTKNLAAGVHQLRVSCYDYPANNEAVALRNFEVSYDDKKPKLTSIFKNERKICINIDESAECRYGFEDAFPEAWDDGNPMVGEEKEKCASLKEGEIYYVMCMDSWVNNATFNLYP